MSVGLGAQRPAWPRLVARAFVGLLIAPALLWAAWLSARDTVVDQARLSRLPREAQRVDGVIERIEFGKRRPQLTTGNEDRTRWESGKRA